MPKEGYQYKKIKKNNDTGGAEEKIEKIFASFGYKKHLAWRMKRSQTFYFIRPYDEKDKKIGVPEKFIGHPRFGVVEVSYYFWDRDDTIPRKISLQTSAGWEFSFSGCRRDYLAMEKVEEALISDGHYKIIYKCIDEVEGFETEAEEKAREKNSLNTFLSLRFAGRL